MLGCNQQAFFSLLPFAWNLVALLCRDITGPFEQQYAYFQSTFVNSPSVFYLIFIFFFPRRHLIFVFVHVEFQVATLSAASDGSLAL